MSVLHNNIAVPKSETSALAHGAVPALPDNFGHMETLERLLKDFPELASMSRKERAEFVDNKHGEYLRMIDASLRKKSKSIVQLEKLKAKADVIGSMLDFCSKPLVIERPDGPSFRRLRKAVADGRALDLTAKAESEVPALDFEKEIFRLAEVLVVEHDWSAALVSADIEKANIRLPYDVCAFEFRFSGQAVIALATQLETETYVCVAVEQGERWIVPDFAFSIDYHIEQNGENLYLLYNVVAAQIRAVCIALDAEVAKSEIVREPHAGQTARNSYQEPRPYHVISLAHRHARSLQHSGASTSRRVRLHFRRGHWRHFEEHKTWIRWMLVGDPDLGFVDKHYRL